jgi:hypothetical protein
VGIPAAVRYSTSLLLFRYRHDVVVEGALVIRCSFAAEPLNVKVNGEYFDSETGTNDEHRV